MRSGFIASFTVSPGLAFTRGPTLATKVFGPAFTSSRISDPSCSATSTTAANVKSAGCDPSASNCRERWGDYSAVTIDPGNHRSFYAIGEYAGDWVTYINTTSPRAQWATYIAEITLVPEPSQYALLMIGLGVVGWAARRRKTG